MEILQTMETKIETKTQSFFYYDYFFLTAIFQAIPMAYRKTWVTLDAPLNKLNLHIRGGYILPWQKPENNTFYR